MPVVSTAAMSTVAVVTNGHLVVQEGGKGNKAADSSSTAGSVNSFATAAEEAAYWRTKFEALARESQVTKEEFEEFQEGSRELEAELEAQLEQSEVKIKEYRSLSNRLQMENDQLKSKLEQCHREYHFQITELQTELSEIRSIKDELNRYVRELEQQNDDLERAKRSTLASLEDFETKMNAMIERNAFLESELDEKESLKAAVQRLKDETRDLKSELRVVATTQPGTNKVDENSARSQASEVMMVDASVPVQTPASPDNDKQTSSGGSGFKWGRRKSHSSSSEKNNNLDSNRVEHSSSSSSSGRPLTPSARISALNIVGDLLRKVGALELKLSSCRSIVKEPAEGVSRPGDHHHTSSTHNLAYSKKQAAAASPVVDIPFPSAKRGSVASSPSGVEAPSMSRVGSSPAFNKMSNGSLM